MGKHINFVKMHGLGNDFIVIDATTQTVPISKKNIKRWSNRHTGVGFDQLLLIGRSNVADFSCRIFNSDGSEAEQCGNGMRCVAFFLKEAKLWKKKKISLETLAGTIPVEFQDDGLIAVQMGPPSFSPKKAAFLVNEDKKLYQFESLGPIPFSVVSLGNPHVILKVPSIKASGFAQIANGFAESPLFPQGTNVGFMQILSPEHIKLRTFERGSGETFACGSNACAAVAIGVRNQWLKKRVLIELPLGKLWVEWSGRQASSVILIGDAEIVFSGTLN